jgi:RimJ/RimL family protein N-acetyltransferase
MVNGPMKQRQRFDGVLQAAELSEANALGLPVGYDPLQLGWVLLSALDDDDMAPSLSWHAGVAAPPIKQVQGTQVYPRTDAFGFRLWVEDDLPKYRAMICDPDLWRYLPEPAPDRLTDDDLRALIELSEQGVHHLVRAVLHGGAPIGQVRLEFSPDHHSAELSYWLSKMARGKGFGRHAVAVFLAQTLPRHPDLRRLTARVHPENLASERLLLNCGFVPCDSDTLPLRAGHQADFRHFQRFCD